MTIPRTIPQQIFQPRCPRCAKGKLLRGLLSVRDTCSACGLVFKYHDSGDGPAFFAVTIAGFIVTIAACVVEFRYEPPMWLHALLWIPLTFLLCIAILRGVKAILILLEFRTGQLRQTIRESDPT